MRGWTERTVVVILLALVLGCVSPEAKLASYNRKWVGRPFDDFVRVNGIPAKEYTLSDGGKLYTVVAGQSSVPFPAQTTVTSAAPGTAHAITTGGGSIALGCVLRIQVDPGGTIKRIQIERDTTGMWVSSRCHEVLPDDSEELSK